MENQTYNHIAVFTSLSGAETFVIKNARRWFTEGFRRVKTACKNSLGQMMNLDIELHRDGSITNNSLL